MYDFVSELNLFRQQACLRSLPSDDFSSMVNLSSNDYLGLNDRPDLWDVFLGVYSPSTRSMSASSSRLLTGNHPEYRRLEASLSDLYGGRAVLFFNCGYHVNAGVLPALADSHDLIVADKLIHASMIDGCRLADAHFLRFAHNNVSHLRSILQAERSNYQRVFIVTESVFSMDGDVAPLQELVELKREFDCWLYVDEAHGVGVRGSQGEGLVGELGLLPDVDVLVCTCGKALASQGAFVVSSPTVHDWLVNKCRTLIFTTALPPINVAWTDFVMDRVRGMHAERSHLDAISRRLCNATGAKSQSQIVPLICGENDAAVAMSNALCSQGFYVLPIRHPTVPKGQARLRFSLKANITDSEINRLVDALNNHFLLSSRP